MTYETRETSMQLGEPLELYEFSFGENIYRYTSAASEILHLGETWAPAFLKRGSIDFSAEKGRNNLSIDTVRNFPVADFYRIMPPADVILLTVRRLHVGDSDSIVVWSGRLLGVEFQGSRAVMTCEPVTTSLRRTGLRRIYQRQCPHVLYGTSCGVNKSSFAVPATLSAVSGVSLTSATFGLYAAGYFAGGYIEFDNAGVIERRFITEHTGTLIKINLPLIGLDIGVSITAYAGCDHTIPTCKNTFNNLGNYGGFPYIPRKNPFGGNGIY